MAIPAPDILTRRYFPLPLPPSARIVDLQPDPRGGYFAPVDVARAPREASPGIILKLNDAHDIVKDVMFSVSPDAENITSTVAMTVSDAGIFVVGMVGTDHGTTYQQVYVARFSLDLKFQMVRVFRPLLLDGCRNPYPFHCVGRGIVRLPPPDDERLMVLFQTSVLTDGTGTPPADDVVSAAVFTIDDDLGVTSDVTRLFCRGQFMPSRLRVLKRHGPIIVGRTRAVHPQPGPWMPCWASVDRDCNPGPQRVYEVPGVLNDVADGVDMTLGVGTMMTQPFAALSMSMDAAGTPYWFARHTPSTGGGSSSCGLNVLASVDDVLIAGGMLDPAVVARPWLAQLEPSLPNLYWQKRYEVAAQGASSQFHALLFRSPDLVVAGGEIPTGPAQVTRVSFLAVSATGTGTADPQCSRVPTTHVELLHPVHSPGTLWHDRMPIIAQEASRGFDQANFTSGYICPEPMPPG